MVSGQRTVLRCQCRPTGVSPLVCVQLDRQAQRLGCIEDAHGLLRREPDVLAETIHRIGEPRAGDCGQDFIDNKVDVSIRPALELRRHRMRAQESRLHSDRGSVSEQPCDPQHPEFCRQIEPVPRLDLHRCNAFGEQGLQPPCGRGRKLMVGGLSCRKHRGHDPAACARNLLVARAIEPHLEFGGTISAVDQVRVAIHQAGRDPRPFCIQYLCRQRLRRGGQVVARPDPLDASGSDADGAVPDRTIGRAAGAHRCEIRIYEESIEHADMISASHDDLLR